MARICYFSAVLVFAAAMGTLTIRQLDNYHDELALWRQAVAEDENNAIAQCWLAITLARNGMADAAIEHYQRSIAIKPDSSFAHYNLGLLLFDLGRFSDATEQFQEFVRICPNMAMGHYSLGNSLIKSGRAVEGYRSLLTAVHLNPQFLKAQFNLAIAHAILHRPQEAIAAAEQAIQMARAQHKPNAEHQIIQWLNEYRTSLGLGPRP